MTTRDVNSRNSKIRLRDGRNEVVRVNLLLRRHGRLNFLRLGMHFCPSRYGLVSGEIL